MREGQDVAGGDSEEMGGRDWTGYQKPSLVSALHSSPSCSSKPLMASSMADNPHLDIHMSLRCVYVSFLLSLPECECVDWNL